MDDKSLTQERYLEQKMQLAQEGDTAAYHELLSEISHIIRNFLRKNITEPADLEDVVQEALVSIHKARHTYDPARPLMPWVYSIAKYRLNDHLRKVYRLAATDSVDFTTLENSLEHSVTEDGDMSEVLSKALNVLPEKQKDIVILMKVEGLTAKEVAERFEMSVSAVKVTAHRAYKKLKDELERLGYENG